MNTHAIGLVPTLTPEDLLVLDPPDRALIMREHSRTPGESLEFQDDLSQAQIRTIMDLLNIVPVWGRDGLVVYRFNLDGKVQVFAVAPDVEKDFVPANILEREWIPSASIPEFLQKMVDFARGEQLGNVIATPQSPLLLPEDHPEEGCIGFIAPNHNRVFLLPIEAVGRDLEAGNTGGWAQVPHLIQSNQGRLELASRISQNCLQTESQFQAQFADFAQRSPQPQGMTRRQQQEIVVDLLSGQLSDRYKTRYLPKKGDA